MGHDDDDHSSVDDVIGCDIIIFHGSRSHRVSGGGQSGIVGRFGGLGSNLFDEYFQSLSS